MKILVTSDNHLGYRETDPVRSDDTFITLEEILCIAKTEKVDFILQGGDLFDQNKPSRNTYNKTLQLLKKHCLGDFKQNISTYPPLNFQDVNLKVALPILSIHGNHDDPSGFNSLSPLDILHSSGLIHYFGRVDDVDNIVISPIVIEDIDQSNTSSPVKLAIYGLGHIKDRRIFKTFNKGNVRYNKLDEISHPSKIFNILVVHQNRAPREGEYLSEDLIDPFFDLVIYGHEHESLKLIHSNFDVIQSGSTVRTSMCEGESFDKYVYILDITDKININRIKLNTVRPLLLHNLKLKDKENETTILEKAEELLNSNRSHMVPLLRLKIEIEGENFNINKHKIQEFLQTKVANPNDAVKIIKRNEKARERPASVVKTNEIEDIYKQILNNYELKALVQPKILESLNEFIEKDCKDAFSTLIKDAVQSIIEHINLDDLVVDSIDDSIKEARKKILKETNCLEIESLDELISEDVNSSIINTETVDIQKKYLEQMCDTVPLPKETISFNDSTIITSKSEFTFIEEKDEKDANLKVLDNIKEEAFEEEAPHKRSKLVPSEEEIDDLLGFL